MNLLVFGGGLIGGHVARAALARGWRAGVAATSARPGLPGVDWQIVDITQAGAVDAALEAVQPDAVVNAAAMSGIDQAEREQERAWQVNVEGAVNVARSCAGRGIRLVFFSSDAVLDGERGPYSEGDRPAPVNYYGRTKAAAERAVLEAWPQAVVLRISLVLGFPVTGGSSYLAGLEARLAAGREVPCPTDEIRTPIDVATLSACVLELAGDDVSGLLNLGATGWTDRYDLACRLAKAMGYPAALVRPEGPEAGRAPRHRNGTLAVARAQQLLNTRLPGLDEAIARAVAGRARASTGGGL